MQGPSRTWLLVVTAIVVVYPHVVFTAAGPAARSDYSSPLDSEAERMRMTRELKSTDPSRVAAAVDEVRRASLPHPTYDMLLIDAGLYAEAETASIDGTIKEAQDGNHCGGFAEVRARALLAEQKPMEALQAAKSCYNASLLRKTSTAIQLVSDCLAAAYPNDPDIVVRFRTQQVAWASVQSSASPHDGPGLGPPVLSSIHVDGTPFQAAIDRLNGLDFAQLTAKGNLLLVVDRPKEARKLFESALTSARDDDQITIAVENIARAIRAEDGCVGPANAYILSLRQKN